MVPVHRRRAQLAKTNEAAVKKAGVMADDVEKELKKK
jgi:hypothetical protein